MNETLTQLMAGIIMNPDDDTPRLMFADELLETGDPQNAILSEYIRLSIELVNHKKLLQPRKDGKVSGVVLEEGRATINTLKWYEKGIDLDKRLRKSRADKRVINHPLMAVYSHLLFKTDRGLIHDITCTVSQFLQVADKLIWHESMAEVGVCPVCTGDGRINQHHDPASDTWRGGKKCYFCKGTGETIPRPCPPTAHPVREITINEPIHYQLTIDKFLMYKDVILPICNIGLTVIHNREKIYNSKVHYPNRAI